MRGWWDQFFAAYKPGPLRHIFYYSGVILMIDIGMYINAIIFIGIVLITFVGVYLFFVRNFFKD